MPQADIVIWAVAVFLIVSMLGIIGYLIDSGFKSLKEQIQAEIQKLWDKLDKHQELAEKNALEIAAVKARCEERHR